jgi:hypothetical protein
MEVKMTIDEIKSIDSPDQLKSKHLQAIWYDLHGDWDTAHRIVQNMSDVHAEWIHAFLHREEGDEWNSKYWYRRCDRPFPGDMPFEEEITLILSELP